ncbi:hypothetical protein A3A69_01880 [candidate division WWE3 bacterium RIFCSPLOWO2_01_FULL_37_15]|uniref:Rod shape-determining protein MreD n=1 Tax=candidate division WWE3 bacterium RIFCSPLOWO2_01_FULL_37_15 TaxID=1802622 RepID=A0A1F4V3I0_UNCKA|nr:MAG: hypothetical protein A3A69_01880 [candidate division WWE3 bacterium RIFCSPLOWO2_01_FULL_37_15]
MGKIFLILLIINILLSLVQVSFVPVLFSNNIYLNLVLAFSFGFLALNKTKEAYISALIGGLIIDSLGVVAIGISSFVYCAGLYSAYFIHEKFIKRYAIFFSIIPVDVLYQLLILKQIEALNIILTFVSFLIFYFLLKKVTKREDIYKL